VALTEAAVGVCLSSLFVWMALQEVPGAETMVKSGKVWQAAAVTLLLMGILMYAMLDAPKLGDPQAIVHQNIAKQYLERTPSEIGIPSVVAAVLASYRGIDTLGETVVVLIAALAVAVLLRTERPAAPSIKNLDVSEPIATHVGMLCLPLCWLFGAYILWHGEVSPGGGFQAGAIWATSWMLYLLLFGSGPLASVLPLSRLLGMALIGVLVYIGVGVVCMLCGGEFLRYQALPFAPVTAQHLAIIVVELAIAATVTASLTWVGAMLLAGAADEGVKNR
jgi:multicomponent Na+:H+ antiporter subunit B